MLGIGPTVGAAEIRRAYRQLALRHHPDRAGPAGTAMFQRIAEAYRVLSDPAARTSYDTGLRQSQARGAHHASQSTTRPSASRPAGGAVAVIARLSGSLETLLGRGVARARPNGVIELLMTPEEARRGGTVAIQLPLDVPCPTCGGLAGPGSLWCRRCEFAGTVVEDVTLHIAVPPLVPDGATFRLTGAGHGETPALTIRIRV